MAEQIKGLTTKGGEAPAAKPKAAPKPEVPDEEALDERELDEAAVEARKAYLNAWPLDAPERR